MDLLKRIIAALGQMEVRALVNVGDYKDQYTDVPANVHIDSWYPQPSVIPKVDAVIHHGGNNSFTECLYFGKPAIIMPYVWDGHDNATRVDETGHGIKMDRYDWTDADLKANLERMLTDRKMKAKLKATSKLMRSRHGPDQGGGRARQAGEAEGGVRQTMVTKLDSSAPHLTDPLTHPGPFKDWGVIPTMIEGQSHTSGLLLFKGPNGESETGIWICTPGYWNCHVINDEFCHFLAGRATYTHESGEVIEIVPAPRRCSRKAGKAPAACTRRCGRSTCCGDRLRHRPRGGGDAFGAVDGEGGARDVGGFVGGEVDEHRGDLFGPRVAAGGDDARSPPAHLGRVLRLLHRRHRVAGVDGVDAHLGASSSAIERMRPSSAALLAL